VPVDCLCFVFCIFAWGEGGRGGDRECREPKWKVAGVGVMQHGCSGSSSSLDCPCPVLTAFCVSVLPLPLVTCCCLSPLSCCPSDSFDLSGLSPPAAAAVTGSRALWSAQAAGRDASDAVGKAAQESLQSLSSQDEDEYYMNPNDPTRVSVCKN
jgi:hypothetical protein